MRRLLASGLVLLLVACSSVETADPTNSTIEPDPSPTTVLPTSTISTSPTPVSVPPTTLAEAEPFLPGLDMTTVIQLTPTSGAGRRPILTWEPVAGAATYTVLVMAADELPWWSWSGSETEVVLGGVDTELEMGGPAAGAGVTWVVFAFDGDDKLIGVSPRRDLAA